MSKKHIFLKPCTHPKCTRRYVALVTRVIPCQLATSSCSSASWPCQKKVSICKSMTHGVSILYTLSVECRLSQKHVMMGREVPLHLQDAALGWETQVISMSSFLILRSSFFTRCWRLHRLDCFFVFLTFNIELIILCCSITLLPLNSSATTRML